MTPKKCLPTTFSVLMGQRIQAQYIDPGIELYRHNPLLAALPSILSTAQAMEHLAYYPPYNVQERELPPELRMHCVEMVTQFYQPLSIHLSLEQSLSRMLRTGYLARNPAAKGYWAELVERERYRAAGVKPKQRFRSNANGFSIIGISGIGKSTAVNSILSLYPQVIFHHEFEGQPFSFTQVVWLKIECPGDASLKGFCLSFFQALDDILDTHYFKHYAKGGAATVDAMLPAMARVAGVHALGLLAIDESQNLSEARSGGEKRMLNQLVALENVIGVPVVLLGTYKVLPVLVRNEFRQARRMTGEGDLTWDRMDNDAEWQLFLRSLWRYQYTREHCKLTGALADVLYEVSQGITDIAVKIYKLAQIRAISTSREILSASIIRSVTQDSLRLLEPALAAMRKGDKLALSKFEDIYPEWKMTFPASTGTDPTAPAMPVNEVTSPSPAKTRNPATQISLETPDQPPSPGDKKKPEAERMKSTPPAKSIVAPASHLPEIVAQGQKQKRSAYDSLKQAGYIQPASEFLATETIP